MSTISSSSAGIAEGCHGDVRRAAADPARLEALEALDILDTPAESGFDDVVELASLVCHAPIALVSLVDRERQWFKARVGFERPETSLDRSICAHVLDRAELLVIPDLTLDPRTANNPMVRGEETLRFYAGAPLVTEGGEVIGSLCVMDRRTRPGGLSAREGDALRRLARQVMSQIELRRSIVRRDELVENLRTASREEALRTRRQVALAELGERLRTLGDVGEIAQAAAQILAGALDAQRAGFGTVDAERETVFMRPNWCVPGVVAVEGMHQFRDYGSFIDDLKDGRSVIVRDVAEDERTKRGAEALVALGIRALVNLPVIEQGRFVLVVFAHFREPHDLSAEEIAFVVQVADRTQAAMARIRAEEQQRTLHHELAHRMKNTLAMVQAIATQTLRQARTVEEGREAIGTRLAALGRAQDILTRTSWKEADIADVVAAAVEPHGPAGGRRISFEGPAVALNAQQALGLSLAIHELATNATKYGALSNETGHVDMHWTSRDGDFGFRWEESGGPVVVEPTRRGFGSRLIERIVGSYFGGEGRVAFPPEGLRFQIEGRITESAPALDSERS